MNVERDFHRPKKAVPKKLARHPTDETVEREEKENRKKKNKAERSKKDEGGSSTHAEYPLFCIVYTMLKSI